MLSARCCWGVESCPGGAPVSTRFWSCSGLLRSYWLDSCCGWSVLCILVSRILSGCTCYWSFCPACFKSSINCFTCIWILFLPWPNNLTTNGFSECDWALELPGEQCHPYGSTGGSIKSHATSYSKSGSSGDRPVCPTPAPNNRPSVSLLHHHWFPPPLPPIAAQVNPTCRCLPHTLNESQLNLLCSSAGEHTPTNTHRHTHTHTHTHKHTQRERESMNLRTVTNMHYCSKVRDQYTFLSFMK